MKALWAPWRMDYILSIKTPGCIFCDYPKEDPSNDRKNLVLMRSKLSFIIMNLYPYNNGHVMVVPYRHVNDIDLLSDDERSEIMMLSNFSVKCLKKAFSPEGFNIGMNIGRVAGAGIDEHLHMHIVPRWAGDLNFMTTIADIRVMPEHIAHTYEKLFPVFNDGNSAHP